MASSELRLNIPLDQAREAIGSALTAQGFAVSVYPSGSLGVTRGSLGATIAVGAFAGDSLHVKFDVHLSPTDSGTLARLEGSTAGGFFKGGAIGAAKYADVLQETAHRLGTTLAERGLLEGSVPAGSADPAVAEAVADRDQLGQPVAPAQSGAVIPPPIDYANRTNVVSIIALVLGFLLPIGGIIAGAVGLAQVKRTKEKGRGLAIAGIIVGSVLSLLWLLLIVVFVILAFVTSQTDPATDGLSQPPAQSSPLDGDDATSTDTESVDVFAVRLGDCLGYQDAAEVTDVELVDCAAPHDYEVFHEFTIEGDTFPGLSEVESIASDGCYEAFPAFAGIAYEDSYLDYSTFYPTEASWESNEDRTVTCLITDPGLKTTGTLAGAAR